MAENVSTLLVNRPPNITWHRLKMNDVSVELPELQSVLACEGTPALSDGTPCFTVQPAGQVSCASLLGDVAGAEFFEAGMGEAAESWLEAHAAERLVVDVPAGKELEEPVVLNVRAQEQANAVLLLDVIVREDARAHIVVQVDSESAGEGTVGVYARIAALDRARVRFTSLQTLDDGWAYLENTGFLLGDDARVEVRQTVLGGESSYVGLGSNQVGDRSKLDVDVRYLGTGNHVLDFNYAMRMRGLQGDCVLVANGVLVDSAAKTLRDTIDLVHGCKGSVGNESETVLLANETVRNKSLPVILCDEDDVQGNHGATIGHINPTQLEYMLSRGLTVEQVEALFTSAIFDYAAEVAATGEGAAAVRKLAKAKLGAGWNEE